MIGATTMTKRAASIWIAAGLLAGLALAFTLSAIQSAQADGHVTGTESLVLSKTELNFVPGTRNSRESTWVYGSGFTPGTRLQLLYQESTGAYYDISFAGANFSTFPIVVNDDGAFAGEWRLGRLTRNRALVDALVTLYATNADTGQDLASAPLALCNMERNADLEEGADPAEVPDFCSA